VFVYVTLCVGGGELTFMQNTGYSPVEIDDDLDVLDLSLTPIKLY